MFQSRRMCVPRVHWGVKVSCLGSCRRQALGCWEGRDSTPAPTGRGVLSSVCAHLHPSSL